MASNMFSVLPTSCLVAALFFCTVAYPLAKYTAHLIFGYLTLRHVPGPSSPSRLWGVEWHLYHDAPGVHYVDWHAQYGKVVKLSGAFGHPILSITDRRAISFILNEATYKFPKPHGVRAWFKALVGEGILWIEGKEQHERHRRHIAPTLTQQMIRKFLPVFYETSSTVASHWSKKIDQTTSDQVEIDATHWAGRFALDTIGRAAFSYDFDSLNDEPNPLADALDGLTNNENRLSSFYMRALFWIFPSILKIGKKGEMIRQTKSALGEIASKLLAQAQDADDPESNTLLSMMLRSPAGHEMTEEYLVAQMRTIISAAYETVSAVIAWMLYELAVHPDLQQRLREEVTFPGDPTYEDLMNKFPLLDAIFRETLRVHPVVLENHHVAAETISVPLNERLPGTDTTQLVVPKGTIISIPVNVIQGDKGVWGPDAQIFRPERWLDHSPEKSRLQREILAFSEGPRSCIGKTFAAVEIKALVVTLVRQFSFSSPYDIEAFQSFVIRPRIKGHGASSLPLLVRRNEYKAVIEGCLVDVITKNKLGRNATPAVPQFPFPSFPSLAPFLPLYSPLPSRSNRAGMLFDNLKACFSPSVSRSVREVWVRNGGTLAHTKEDFYKTHYFLCAGLDDEWVKKLMLKSRVVFHYNWVLIAAEQKFLVPVGRFVLDEFFNEDNMPRPILNSTGIPPSLPSASSHLDEGKNQTKKRTRDELDASVTDINMHASKRPRLNNTTPDLKHDPQPCPSLNSEIIPQTKSEAATTTRERIWDPVKFARPLDSPTSRELEQRAADQPTQSPLHQVRFYASPASSKRGQRPLNVHRFEPSSSPIVETNVRPLATLRGKIQQEMNDNVIQTRPHFLVKTLCSFSRTVDSTIFGGSEEHMGKIFRVHGIRRLADYRGTHATAYPPQY